MARGNLPALPPADPRDAIQQLYVYLNTQRKAFDTLFTVKGDFVIDIATKGLVLKDTQIPPHYWRVTVNTSGVLVTTDLGESL